MAKVKGLYKRGRMWWLRYTPAPGLPQVREPLGTHLEQLAAMKAIEILQRAPLERSGELEEQVEEYLADSHLSQTTVHSRRTILMSMARDCGMEKLSDLSVKGVERWLGILKEGGGGEGDARKRAIAEGTIESYWFAVRAFCRWLVKKNRLRENPAVLVGMGKVTKVVRKNFVSAEDVRKLIDQAPDDEMRFILFCGFLCGMRKLEIVEARPNWFELGVGGRRGRISIVKTATFSGPKDREERTIPLPREFEEFLVGFMGALPDGAQYMLRPEKKKGKNRYRYDFRRPFALHMKANGVKASVHDMRRTFVSLKLIQDSSLIFKLAKWTGASVKVLQDHYGHLLADDEDIELGGF